MPFIFSKNYCCCVFFGIFVNELITNQKPGKINWMDPSKLNVHSNTRLCRIWECISNYTLFEGCFLVPGTKLQLTL